MSGITLDEIESVAIISTGGNELAIDASGYVTANINGSVTVTATDLDIRDLNSANDNVEIQTAAGQALSIDGSGYLTVNGNGNFTVVATQLDIDDLNSTDDEVGIGDGTNSLVVNSDGSINTVTVENATSSWKTTADTVTTTAAELVATPLTGRRRAIIQNLGLAAIYIGPDGTVTASNGLRIARLASFEHPFESDANIFAITASGSASVRIAEFAA